MDINLISSTITQANTGLQKEILAYYEQLQKDTNGWRFAINTLAGSDPLNETAVFFCLQVIESHVRSRYDQDNEQNRLVLRQFVGNWFSQSSSVSNSNGVGECTGDTGVSATSIPKVPYIFNKYAAIVTQIFLLDFPFGRWDSFFFDFLTNCKTEQCCELFLRILLQINLEIADRELARTIKECERNTQIKDKMRDTCLTELAQFWFDIINTYRDSSTQIVCLCLNVMGAYISWIDIGLITNESVMSSLFQLFVKPTVRCDVIACFQGIFQKGMDPLTKLQFAQQFLAVPCIIENLETVHQETDSRFLLKLAALFSLIGQEMLESLRKLRPKQSNSSDPNTIAQIAQIWQLIESKVELLCKFLSHPDFHVSIQVHPFAREYIHWLRNLTSFHFTPEECKVKIEYTSILLIKILLFNCKYPDDYELDDDDDDDDESEFDEFRKSTKTLFENLMLLNADGCSKFVCSTLVEPAFKNLQLDCQKFNEIETPLFFLSLMGENYGLMSDKQQLEQLIQVLITSPISKHPHPCIQLMYFELISRYEKMFANSLNALYPQILTSFLDERGFKNSNQRVRNRSILLFAKFLKAQIKSKNSDNLLEFAEQIVNSLAEFIDLDSFQNIDLKQLERKPSLNEQDPALFESISILIVANPNLENNRKLLLISQLIFDPVLKKFQELFFSAERIISSEPKLGNGFATTTPTKSSEEASSSSSNGEHRLLAFQFAHLISLITHSSKAFTAQLSVKSIRAQSLFLNAFKEFHRAMTLSLNNDALAILQSALRQLLHRYIVCLDESDIVPLLPNIIEHIFLPSACFTVTTIQELVPLLNQITSKFKNSWMFAKDFLPFLNQLFLPFISFIFTLTNSPALDDEDKTNLQKSYFFFLHIFACNNLIELFINQEASVFEQILVSLVQGLELNDSTAQKSCLIIIRKIFESQASEDQSPSNFLNNPNSDASTSDRSAARALSLRNNSAFTEYIYSTILPSCWNAYLKQSDEHPLSNEFCHTLSSILKFRGQQEFCAYFGQLLVSKYSFPKSNELVAAVIANDQKTMKMLFKQLFNHAKKLTKQ